MTYFQDAEFFCPCPLPCVGKRGPHRLLWLYLDRAREMLGEPIVITSGNRCVTHNLVVGGEAVSEHVHPDGCLGCDVRASTSRDRFKMLDAFRHAGFTRFVLYHADRHIHVGVGESVDPEAWPPNVVAVK